jgi:hypothetical protein
MILSTFYSVLSKLLSSRPQSGAIRCKQQYISKCCFDIKLVITIILSTSYYFYKLFLRLGCPALGIWVGFLKQPALPSEAPQIFFYQYESVSTMNNNEWMHCIQF